MTGSKTTYKVLVHLKRAVLQIALEFADWEKDWEEWVLVTKIQNNACM